MKTFLTVFVLLITLPFVATASAEPMRASLAGNWFDATQEELRRAGSAIDNLQPHIDRLERELRSAKTEIAEDDECRTLDCGEIAVLLREAEKIETAAYTSLVLNGMALRQLSDYSETHSATISALSKGRSTLRTTLMLQEIAQTVAELSAGVAAALITGDVRDVGQQLSVLSATLANYGVNAGVNLGAGQRDLVGGAASDAVGANQVSGAHARLVSSLSAHLTSVGVFTPGQGVSLSFKPMALNLTGANVADISTRAFVGAIAEVFVGETRQQLASAISDHDAAVAGHRDALLAVTFQKITIEEFKGKRRDLMEQIGRLRTLAADCRATASSFNCSDHLEARLDDVESRYDAIKQAAYAAQEAAMAPLDRAREEWSELFGVAVASHNALRTARDKLAEAQRLSNERTRLEELARGAADAEKREKYRADLARLEALGDVGELEANVQALEDKRASAWRELEEIEAAIDKALPAALAGHEAAAVRLAAAEEERSEGLSTARAALYECLESAIPDASGATTPARAALRAQIGDSVDPGIIFAGLHQGLASFQTKIAAVSIHAVDEDGAPCAKEIASLPESGSAARSCWMPITPDWIGPTWLEMEAEEGGTALFHLGPSDHDSWGYSRIFADRLTTSPNINDAASVGEFQLNRQTDGLTMSFSYSDEQAVRKRFPGFTDLLIARLSSAGAMDVFKLEEVSVPGGAAFQIDIQTGEWALHDVVEPAWSDGYEDRIIVGTFRPLGYESYYDGSTIYSEVSVPAGAVNVFDRHYIAPSEETVPVAFGRVDEPWRHAHSPLAINKAGEPADEPLVLGQHIGLEIQSSRNCPGKIETIELRIEPSANPQMSQIVRLVETAANSGLYRLADDTEFSLSFSTDDIGSDGGIYLYPDAYIGRKDDPRRQGEFVQVIAP